MAVPILISGLIWLVTVNGKLTKDICKSYDQVKIQTEIMSSIETVDEILAPSLFTRASGGMFLTSVVSEQDGQLDGGGTNSFGSYGVAFFNATEALPAGLQDFLGHDQNTRVIHIGNYSSAFVLGPMDVVSLLICTPLPMRYYGHDLVVFARTTNEYVFWPGQNFGDTLNSENLNASSTMDSEEGLQPTYPRDHRSWYKACGGGEASLSAIWRGE